MPFDYNALVESQLQGQLSQGTLNRIAQSAAERGVGRGVIGGPQVNSAYAALTGIEAEQQVARGQKAYEAQQQIALENRKVDELAREFYATMTFKEKELAQQLGLTREQYALEKAKMELQAGTEAARLGEEKRQFDLSQPLKERELSERERANTLQFNLGTSRLGEEGRQFDVGQNWNQTQLGEDTRRYNQQFPLSVANLSPQASWNYSWLTGAPSIPSYTAPKTGSYYAQDPTATSTLYQMPGSTSWSSIRPH